MKLSQNETSPTTLINSLKNEEKEILDTLLYVAGMHKKLILIKMILLIN